MKDDWVNKLSPEEKEHYEKVVKPQLIQFEKWKKDNPNWFEEIQKT